MVSLQNLGSLGGLRSWGSFWKKPHVSTCLGKRKGCSFSASCAHAEKQGKHHRILSIGNMGFSLPESRLSDWTTAQPRSLDICNHDPYICESSPLLPTTRGSVCIIYPKSPDRTGSSAGWPPSSSKAYTHSLKNNMLGAGLPVHENVPQRHVEGFSCRESQLQASGVALLIRSRFATAPGPASKL